MDVKEAIAKRRSIRNFKSKEVATEKINEVLKAGQLAPSGSNLQPWRFVVVESEEIREKLEGATLDFVAEAPAIIVCCVDYNSLKERKKRFVELQKAGAFAGTDLTKVDPSSYKSEERDEEEIKRYLHLNCAIAIENMTLQATELGLGSCWVMMFNEQKVTKLLDLDDNLDVVSLLPIGYPDQNPERRPRLDLEELIVDRV
ncbi:nitroreductase family protein [Halanaerobaculum tunisiense]